MEAKSNISPGLSPGRAFARAIRPARGGSRVLLGRAVLWAGLQFSALGILAQGVPDLSEQLKAVQRQNELLQSQLSQQKGLIESLTEKVSALESDRAASGAPPANAETRDLMASKGPSFTSLNISGEGSFAFMHSESKGRYPNSEFRVDEAKLFLESPIYSDVYFFTELDLFVREQSEANLRIGEVYLDFENLSRFWGQEGQLTLRVGRFDIPFGEEYMARDAIDNPLITHSLSDIWGVDEGVEIYGRIGKLQYAMAVQNGGNDALHDYDGDKAVVARLSYDPTRWLHLSVSGMRTGDLHATNDKYSELWLGPGFMRSIGSTNTTSFEAQLVEGDAQVHWKGGHVKTAGGYIHYQDDDPLADNSRDIYYYYVEGVQNILPKLYAAARWSQMFVDKGYPIAGNANAGQYFFSRSAPLTTDLWLLSLGLGYRLSNQLIVKVEYSFEQGELANGRSRRHENTVGAAVAFRF